MLRVIIFFGLLFASIFVLYATMTKDHSQALHIKKINNVSHDYKVSDAINDIDNHLVNPNPVNIKPNAPKSPIKGVSLDASEIKQLKLNNFHAYLRYQDRLDKEVGTSPAEYILTPEQRKEVAKERLAVKLIDVLSSRS